MANPLMKANNAPLMIAGVPKLRGTRQWVGETVEVGGGGNNRQHASIADISGNIGVSYARNSELRYAEKDTVTGVWTYHTVDTRPSVGQTSLVELATGYPAIFYHSVNGLATEIRLAEYNGTIWTTALVATANNPSVMSFGGFDSVGALVNALPAVTYVSYDDPTTTTTLHYWRAGVSEVIVSINTGFQENIKHSLYQVGADAAVVYQHPTTYDMSYADRVTTWSPQFIENVGGAGGDSSLHVINGQPAIAYYRQSPQNPKYARYNGATWDIETISALTNKGQEISLTEHRVYSTPSVFTLEAAVAYLGTNKQDVLINIDAPWSTNGEVQPGGFSCSIAVVAGVLCFATASVDCTIGCLFTGCCCDWPF